MSNDLKVSNDAKALGNEMGQYLLNQYKSEIDLGEPGKNPEDLTYHINAAIYWYANDYHEGQWSPLYSIVSTSVHKPRPNERNVKDVGGYAEAMYNDLVNKYQKGYRMASFVLGKLDKVADTLESKGLVKEASEIDVISNTLEKMSKKSLKQNTRPEPVFSDTDPKVNDNKDHFPINTMDRARNALQRVNQYSEVPDWYDGSLSEVKKRVVSAVKKKYPSIEIDEEKYKE